MYKNPNGDKTNIERQFLLAHRLKQNKYSDDLESGDASMMARWRWLVGDELMSFLIELWFDTRYQYVCVEHQLVLLSFAIFYYTIPQSHIHRKNQRDADWCWLVGWLVEWNIFFSFFSPLLSIHQKNRKNINNNNNSNQKIEKNLVGAAVLANDNSSCLGFFHFYFSFRLHISSRPTIQKNIDNNKNIYMKRKRILLKILAAIVTVAILNAIYIWKRISLFWSAAFISQTKNHYENIEEIINHR